MLDDLFIEILDLSITASLVILFVMLARLCLKKLPKMISYALWAVVLLRLLCPMSLELPVSILPERTPVKDTYSLSDTPVSVVDACVAAYHAAEDTFQGSDNVLYIPTARPTQNGEVEYVQVLKTDVWILFGQYVWLAGVAAMLIHSLVSYIKLRSQMAVKVELEKGIFICDDITSPFVMGVFRPTVYLPSGMAAKERSYIIAHERHHIRRMDHVWKLLAYVALTLHWFNPLVWIAFILACKDMEMSCDEAVIRQLGTQVRAEYAASLASLATGKRIIAGTPLAFGEGDPKSRIRNLAKWKKPAIWAVVTAACLSLLLSACLMIDPIHSDMPTISTPPTQETNTALTQPEPTAPTSTQGAEPSVQIPEGNVTDAPFVMYLGVSNYQNNGLPKYSINPVNILAVVNPLTGQVLLLYTPESYVVSNPAKNGLQDKLSMCGRDTVQNSMKVLSELYGVPVEYYVHINERGICNLVDLFGGIRVTSQVECQVGDLQLQAGENILTGKQVLAFGGQGDTGKNKIEILGALLRKLRDANPDQIQKKLEGQIATNMTQQEILSLQRLQGENGRMMWKIAAYEVSGEYTYQKLAAYPGEQGMPRICVPDMETVEYARELAQQVIDGEALMPGAVSAEIQNKDDIRIVKTFELPAELVKAEMALEGREIVSVTDAAMLRSIHSLFSNAEWLGYEPKTYSLGPMLTLTGPDGTVVTGQICLETDLILVDGLFYDYGPGYNEEGARNAILHMLNLFGLHDWPSWMYEWYADTGWSLVPPAIFARYP